MAASAALLPDLPLFDPAPPAVGAAACRRDDRSADFVRQTIQSLYAAAAGDGSSVALLIVDLPELAQLRTTAGPLAAELLLSRTLRQLRRLESADCIAEPWGENGCILIAGGFADPSEIDALVCATTCAADAALAGFSVRPRLTLAAYPDNGADFATVLEVAEQLRHRSQKLRT